MALTKTPIELSSTPSIVDGGNATAITIDSSENVGIGTSSPSALMHLKGADPILKFEDSAGGDTFGIFASASDFLGFYNFTDNRTDVVIDGSGNLVVGKTAIALASVGGEMRGNGLIASSVASAVNGSTTMIVYSTTASAYRFYVGMGGTVYATNTTISGISDIRYKENIRDLDDGLAKVMQLQPRKFDWKEGKGKDIANDRGFIAQEFEEVFPDLISEWKDPAPEGEEPYKAVSQDLIPTLVKAIQELKEELNTATARITALENN